MTPTRIKLRPAVTFMKYLASVTSLLFIPKILIWNKITFRLTNSLNLAEPEVNELTKTIPPKKTTTTTTTNNIPFLSHL